MSKPRLLALAGSTRRASFNKQLVAAAAQVAQGAGADVTVVDLADLPLPLFDQDVEAEQGRPDNAATLKQHFVAADGLLLASPEYNSSLTGVLKNAIDWISRPDPGDSPGALTAFRGKVVALFAASPGGLGGLRGLVHARSILSSLGCLVLPDQLAVGSAHKAFGAGGMLADERQQQTLERIVASLVSTCSKLGADG